MLLDIEATACIFTHLLMDAGAVSTCCWNCTAENMVNN